MPRMKLSKALLDEIEVDTRTEIYDSVVRDLELRVEPTPSTVRTWFVRYTLSDGGERKRFKLGRYPDIPVTIAREMAKKVAADALNGKDPSGQRKEDRNALTVRDLGELFIERYSRRFKRTWRDDQAMLVRDIYPLIGTKKASKVSKRDILDILETKLCQGKVPMARCLQVLLSRLFGWAVEQDYVTVSPVTTVKAPGVPAKRDRVLSPVEVRKLWNALPDAAMHPAMADIIRLLLLLGQRSGEVSGMRRSEIDLEQALWTLPPARTKNGLEHSVPLSAPALAIITAAVARAEAAGRDALFSRTQTPVESNNVSKVARMALQVLDTPWKPHDLRRTVVTMMGDIDIEPHVVEVLVNHVSGFRAGVAGVYNKSKYTLKVRAAVDRWAEHLMAIVEGRSGTVVQLRQPA